MKNDNGCDIMKLKHATAIYHSHEWENMVSAGWITHMVYNDPNVGQIAIMVDPVRPRWSLF